MEDRSRTLVRTLTASYVALFAKPYPGRAVFRALAIGGRVPAGAARQLPFGETRGDRLRVRHPPMRHLANCCGHQPAQSHVRDRRPEHGLRSPTDLQIDTTCRL